MLKLINALFQCRHKRCSFPITSKPGQRRSGAATVTGTYYVCLDCGAEFAYDWESMAVVDGTPRDVEASRFADQKLTRRAS